MKAGTRMVNHSGF